MGARYPFPAFPTGWFAVEWSSQLRPGEIQSRTLFGREMVLFRTESGKPALLDAYCPHMGAHLGRGGVVQGETVRCPMHGFQYDGEGVCQKTPYGTKIPPKARLSGYALREHGGVISVWWDELGREPDWTVPAYDTTGWTEPRGVVWRVRSHPQETSENSVDLGHFSEVHGYQDVEVVTNAVVEGPHLWAEYAFRKPMLPGVLVPTQFRADVYGLGYSLVTAEIQGIGTMRFWVLPTPVDGEYIELRLGTAVLRKDVPLPLIPLQRLVYRLFTRIAIKQYCHEVYQDFEIWENKTYVHPPVLAKGDGPVGRYRAWAKQFYPQVAAQVRGR